MLLVLGLTLGVLRILCNGFCTAQKFHTEEHDQYIAVLDARVNPTALSLSLQRVPSVCTTCLHPFEDRLLSFHGETIYSMT